MECTGPFERHAHTHVAHVGTHMLAYARCTHAHTHTHTRTHTHTSRHTHTHTHQHECALHREHEKNAGTKHPLHIIARTYTHAHAHTMSTQTHKQTQYTNTHTNTHGSTQRAREERGHGAPAAHHCAHGQVSRRRPRPRFGSRGRLCHVCGCGYSHVNHASAYVLWFASFCPRWSVCFCSPPHAVVMNNPHTNGVFAHSHAYTHTHTHSTRAHPPLLSLTHAHAHETTQETVQLEGAGQAHPECPHPGRRHRPIGVGR